MANTKRTRQTAPKGTMKKVLNYVGRHGFFIAVSMILAVVIVTNGATYTLKYSSDEMGLFSTDTSGTILNEGAQASTIYARVYTVYDNGSKVTPCGIAELSISAEELFELN